MELFLVFLTLVTVLTLTVAYVIFVLQKVQFNFPEIRVVIEMPRAPVGTVEEGLTSILPDDIVTYVNMESDEWARGVLRARAQTLYGKYGDWGAVLLTLKEENGE